MSSFCFSLSIGLLLNWERGIIDGSCLNGHFPKGSILHLAPNWQGVSCLGKSNLLTFDMLDESIMFGFWGVCLNGHLPYASLLQFFPNLHYTSFLGWLNSFFGADSELVWPAFDESW